MVLRLGKFEEDIRQVSTQNDWSRTYRTRHRTVSLMDQMLSLSEAASYSPHAPRACGSTAADRGATDRQIDALVYELYGLTEEEIAIVEG